MPKLREYHPSLPSHFMHLLTKARVKKGLLYSELCHQLLTSPATLPANVLRYAAKFLLDETTLLRVCSLVSKQVHASIVDK